MAKTCYHTRLDHGKCLDCGRQMYKTHPLVECERCHEEVFADLIHDMPIMQMKVCPTCYIEMGGK